MRLGSDPEIFLQQGNSFKSVIGMIGAGKQNPLQIEGLPEGFTLQEDNVALEFGIPPAATKEEFVKHIQTVLQAGLQKCAGFSFSQLSCVAFPAEELEHPMAGIFGCEPDFNAWTQKENPKPQPPTPFVRSAGGHIHVETNLSPYDVGRSMDLHLGVPSVLMDRGTERRKIYGKAGAIRIKPYGVEYRTLSNFWIFQPRLVEWAWDGTERAVDMLTKDVGYWHENPWAELVQDCINNSDRKLAKQLIKEFHLNVC